MAADEMAVLHCGVRAKKLLEVLIHLASVYVGQASTPLQVNASRGFNDLKQRVLSLGTPQENRNPNWALLSVPLISLVVSVGFSISQARASTGVLGETNLREGLMCAQITHEKIIETWLKLEPSVKKCEM